jgi:hypothetical protein
METTLRIFQKVSGSRRAIRSEINWIICYANEEGTRRWKFALKGPFQGRGLSKERGEIPTAEKGQGHRTNLPRRSLASWLGSWGEERTREKKIDAYKERVSFCCQIIFADACEKVRIPQDRSFVGEVGGVELSILLSMLAVEISFLEGLTFPLVMLPDLIVKSGGTGWVRDVSVANRLRIVHESAAVGCQFTVGSSFSCKIVSSIKTVLFSLISIEW